jgi:hypothetical protein
VDLIDSISITVTKRRYPAIPLRSKKAPRHYRGLSVDKCNLASVMTVMMAAMMALRIRRSD